MFLGFYRFFAEPKVAINMNLMHTIYALSKDILVANRFLYFKIENELDYKLLHEQTCRLMNGSI